MKTFSIPSILFGIICLMTFSPLHADQGTLKTKPVTAKEEIEKDWSLELGSGVLFGNVRTTGLDSYTMIPFNLTASLAVDEVSLDKFWGGIFRGYTEFYWQAYGMDITSGTESRIVGLSMGPRYNFVQPGWKVVPFIQGQVGFGFADSRMRNDSLGNNIGLGQDFNFEFGIGGGVRYDINDSWFVRLSGNYVHFSNAGLSEPMRKNRAIDQAGPELAIGYRF